MDTLKVRFADLDQGFPGILDQKEFFINLLKQRFDLLVLTDDNSEPDLLIYSWLGIDNFKWQNCIRVYYTMEMDYPDFNLCDYAIGLNKMMVEDRFLHFPSYIIYNDLLRKYENEKEKILNETELINRKFCSIVISNDKIRDNIFKNIYNNLSIYKNIDSGGKWNNNIGGPVADKLQFIKNYKFNLAIENSNFNGYVTEKLIEPLIVHSLPIYWGSNWVKEEFGTKGYINISDFNTLGNAIEYIKKVDSNDNLYLDLVLERPILPYTYSEWCNILLDFFENAIKKGKRCNRNMIMGRMYYEKKTYLQIRNSIPGRIYRKYKKILYSVKEKFKNG